MSRPQRSQHISDFFSVPCLRLQHVDDDPGVPHSLHGLVEDHVLACVSVDAEPYACAPFVIGGTDAALTCSGLVAAYLPKVDQPLES